VWRSNVQQRLYHLHDGPEQQERDAKMMIVLTPAGRHLAWGIRNLGLGCSDMRFREMNSRGTLAEWSREMEGGTKER